MESNGKVDLGMKGYDRIRTAVYRAVVAEYKMMWHGLEDHIFDALEQDVDSPDGLYQDKTGTDEIRFYKWLHDELDHQMRCYERDRRLLIRRVLDEAIASGDVRWCDLEPLFYEGWYSTMQGDLDCRIAVAWDTEELGALEKISLQLVAYYDVYSRNE